ncbi:protein kinase [candidate division KSB1 bacterium]|nr:protein kinase [candidate division KSB1 bacterium]
MIGQTILHYKILEKLGEGGMGIVYKAQDTKLKRTVALKFLPQHLIANKTDKARFLQEAQAAAALNHNNVCTIHDIQEHDGQHFIVMEYVEGKTLREEISLPASQDSHLSKGDTGGLPLDKAINYATQIAEALQAAHAKDIIHRDIKSENIMVTSTGQIKVMDFGLAKLRGAAKLTKTTNTVGTLAYSSPEQIQGQEVDARSDIFSFGVVLYEMLTGQLPFSGEYESALMYSILNEKPKTIDVFRNGGVETYQNVVEKCLEKKLENRYQSISELMESMTGQFSVEKKNFKSKKKKTRRRKVIIGIFTVIFSLLVFLTVYIYPFLYLPEPVQYNYDKSIAVLYFDNMSSEKNGYFADGMTEELIFRLSRVKNLKVASRTDVRVFKSKPEPIKIIGDELNVQYVVEGSVRKTDEKIRITAQLINVSDGFHQWSQTYDRDLRDVFGVQDDVANNIVRYLEVLLSEKEQSALSKNPTKNTEAFNLVLKARAMLTQSGIHSSERYYDQIDSLLDQALRLDPDYIEAKSLKSARYIIYIGQKGHLLDKTELLQIIEKGNHIAEQVLAKDPLNEIALSVSIIALSEKISQQSESGFKFTPFLYRKMKIQVNKLYKHYPESFIAHFALAVYYDGLFRTFNKQSTLRNAVDHYEKVLKFSARVLEGSPTDPIPLFMVMAAQWPLGLLYQYEQEYKKAFYVYEDLYSFKKKLGHKADLGIITFRLGICALQLGFLESATAYFNESSTINLELNNTADMAHAYRMLGWMHRNTGQYNKALDCYEKSRTAFLEAGDKFNSAFVLHQTGRTLFLMEDHVNASVYYEKACDEFLKMDEPSQLCFILSLWALNDMKQDSVHVAADKAERAEQLFLKDTNRSDVYITTAWHLALVFKEFGQPEKYSFYLEKAYKPVKYRTAQKKDEEARKALQNRFIDIIKAWDEHHANAGS